MAVAELLWAEQVEAVFGTPPPLLLAPLHNETAG